MMGQEMSATLMALSLASSPIALPASACDEIISYQSSVPSQRASWRRMENQLAPAPLLLPMGSYVGELQELWQFPSDHLPIALSFEGFNIASWNVLDAEYMSWVTEKNSQGLSRSMIADEHIYLGDSGLTVRDKHIADLVLQMLSHQTHPRHILALQECSKPFLDELRLRLPAHFELISAHGDAFIVDRDYFEILEAKQVSGVFTDQPKRTFQDLLLRRLDTQEPLRLVNIHLPGDPLKPSRQEFARYISNMFDPSMATLVMGDMNFNELEMEDAMQEAFNNLSPFTLYSPHCTNISPNVFISQAIDHFFVYSPNGAPIEGNSPDQIMPGLGSIVTLLN